MRLFDQVVPESGLSPTFVQVRDEPSYYPAKCLMSDVFDAWPEAGHQFVRDFQTAGFDARTWELYLRATLLDGRLHVDTLHDRPDFRCQIRGSTFFVEATTSNPPVRRPRAATSQEAMERIAASSDDPDETAIRIGSALFSKQSKRYQDLPHVSGRPLIFAIEPFHDEGSLFQSDGALLRYLFGLALVERVGPGVARAASGPIDQHRHGSKAIPSGWFGHPGNEHVSAVLFSNSGTVAKFNRMGLQAGYTHPRLRAVMRKVYEFDPDPDALVPLVSVEHIDHSSSELWSEGLELIHNPRALHPVDPAWFPAVSQLYQHGDKVALVPGPRHVFTQYTAMFQVVPDHSAPESRLASPTTPRSESDAGQQ